MITTNYPDLDLDTTHVQYSYKHSTLVTLTIDGQQNQRSTPSDDQEWRLPTFDPRNENKYMYKLHTIDIYFWTKDDALQFLNGARRVLPYQQVTVQDEPVAPPPPHHDDMSPIVQKLENVAITDPSYQQGRTRDSRTTNSFPGPPISATPQNKEASGYAPMAYNPAAPAAPEAIKHREKTPPPEDGAANPLMAAAASDQGQTFGAPYGQIGFSGPPGQPTSQHSYFPGPPAQFSQPAPPPSVQSPYAQHFQNTFAPPPTAASLSSPYAQPPPAQATATSSAPPPAYQQQPTHIPVTQYANYPVSPGIQRAMTTPGLYSPGFSSEGTTPSVASPAAPPGGFSQFNYHKVSNTQPLMTDYSIHQQVYRPTESEAAPKAGKALKPPRGKLEERAGQLERGVGGLLKKLEKKIG